MAEGEHPAVALYRRFIDAWNRRDAAAMAACLAPEGHMIGFDGSEAHGPDGVLAHIGPIFRDHPTPAYVTVVRGASPVGAGAVLVRAVAGMAPPGKAELNPALNTLQSLLAVDTGDGWKVALFQNTPAALHGRPELVEAMTRELRAAMT